MPTFDSLAAALRAESPIDIAGSSFDLSLTGFRESQPHEGEAIHIAFTAVNLSGEQHRGELRLGKNRYSDVEIAKLAVHTILEIASGKLPPGARQLI